MFDGIIMPTSAMVEIPIEGGRKYVPEHKDMLLCHVRAMETKKESDIEFTETLRSYCRLIAQKIQKMTPALQVQWETYNTSYTTTSAFNNEHFLSTLLNDLRFFGACARVIANDRPISFLYLAPTSMGERSCTRSKEERGVNIIPLHDGVYYFLISQSKSIFLRHGGTKGASVSAFLNTNLNKGELARLLRRRVGTTKDGKKIEYPSDYAMQVTECKEAYNLLVSTFERTFWTV